MAELPALDMTWTGAGAGATQLTLKDSTDWRAGDVIAGPVSVDPTPTDVKADLERPARQFDTNFPATQCAASILLAARHHYGLLA